MNRIRHIAIVTTGVLASLLALLTVAPAAYAMRLGPGAGSGSAEVLPVKQTGTTVHSSGMAGWEIGLIAISAAVLASALTVVVLRMGIRSALGPAATS